MLSRLTSAPYGPPSNAAVAMAASGPPDCEPVPPLPVPVVAPAAPPEVRQAAVAPQPTTVPGANGTMPVPSSVNCWPMTVGPLSLIPPGTTAAAAFNALSILPLGVCTVEWTSGILRLRGTAVEPVVQAGFCT